MHRKEQADVRFYEDVHGDKVDMMKVIFKEGPELHEMELLEYYEFYKKQKYKLLEKAKKIFAVFKRTGDGEYVVYYQR